MRISVTVASLSGPRIGLPDRHERLRPFFSSIISTHNASSEGPSPLILTVTVNAAVDWTLYVERLALGERHAVVEEHAQAGGKGINVARVLRGMGYESHALVVVGGDTGRRIVRDLEASGVPATAVFARGESRTCVEVVERGTARTTRLHTPGIDADAALLEDIVHAFEKLLGRASRVALCGSLPAGLPDEAYGRLVEEARAHEVPVAVDATGAALREAWRRGPDLLRVTREEAAEALGTRPEALEVPPRDAPGRVGLGIVSDGDGPIEVWSAAGERWRIEPPRVRAMNPIGCGDAMLAGLLAAQEAGSATETALCRATALAAAEAESPVAGRTDPRRGRELEAAVRIDSGSDLGPGSRTRS